MFKYLTGAAAFALAASAAVADPGGGKGGGGDKGGGGGGGNASAAHGSGGKAHDNGGGNSHVGQPAQGGGKDRMAHDRVPQGKPDRGNNEARKEARDASFERGDRKADNAPRADRGRDRADRIPADSRKSFDRRDGGSFPRNGRSRDGRPNDVRVATDRDRGDGGWNWGGPVPQRTRGLIAGCPPGLAKKANGCLPPGQAKKAAYVPVFYDSPNWWNFDDRWHDSAGWSDGSYRYYNGYLVRYGDRDGGGGIDSWLPLLGGALSPGNAWPGQYETQGLPPYYQDYYGIGQPDSYRYYDDTLYRVDPQSNAITAIAALLTGDAFQVGQQMPAGYDVYNVPYSYRDRYPDGGESDYRYSDGSIYQIDPTTQLVQAVIGLLT